MKKRIISVMVIMSLMFTMLPTTVSAARKGCILGGTEPTIFDALEILKYLSGMDSAIKEKGKINAEKMDAATISKEGKKKGGTTIFCALEILKYLSYMDNEIGVNHSPRPPAAPKSVWASAGDGMVTVHWTEPANMGGGTFVRYEVSDTNGKHWFPTMSLSYTFRGLANGKKYTFLVRAVSSAGNGITTSVTATPTPPASSLSDEVVTITNQYRVNAGKSPFVSDNPNLNSAAMKRAQELVAYYDHVRPDGRDWSTVFEEFKVKWSGIAENIAYGYSSPREVVEGWINSPGHYQNIMGNYTHIGVGVARGGDGTMYWVQLFVR